MWASGSKNNKLIAAYSFVKGDWNRYPVFWNTVRPLSSMGYKYRTWSSCLGLCWCHYPVKQSLFRSQKEKTRMACYYSRSQEKTKRTIVKLMMIYPFVWYYTTSPSNFTTLEDNKRIMLSFSFHLLSMEPFPTFSLYENTLTLLCSVSLTFLIQEKINFQFFI